MSVIFIERIRKGDTEAYRDTKKKSSVTVDGKNLNCCRKLTSWFRIGEWVVKHDWANYVLGITKNLNGWEKSFVKRTDFKDGKMVEENCLDKIADGINSTGLGYKGYFETLVKIQEELKGYEDCFYLRNWYGKEFDYKEFLKDKDAYIEKVRKEAKESK